MIIKKIISLLLKPIEKTLGRIGSIINQSPSSEELNKIRQSPFFNNPFKQVNTKPFIDKNSHLKESQHKPKGAVNTDSQIFNKPRK